MTIVASEPTELAFGDASAPEMTRRRHQNPSVILYAGMALVAIGFVVIAFAWGRVAGLDAVPQQVPYLLSGGITGLGLILVGLTAVNVGALHAVEAERNRQLERLTSLVDTFVEGDRR